MPLPVFPVHPSGPQAPPTVNHGGENPPPAFGNCCFCLAPFEEPVALLCGHVYCQACLSAYIASRRIQRFNFACPTCKRPMDTSRHSLRRIYLDTTGTIDLRNKLLVAEGKIKDVEEEIQAVEDRLSARDAEKQTLVIRIADFEGKQAVANEVIGTLENRLEEKEDEVEELSLRCVEMFALGGKAAEERIQSLEEELRNSTGEVEVLKKRCEEMFTIGEQISLQPVKNLEEEVRKKGEETKLLKNLTGEFKDRVERQKKVRRRLGTIQVFLLGFVLFSLWAFKFSLVRWIIRATIWLAISLIVCGELLFSAPTTA